MHHTWLGRFILITIAILSESSNVCLPRFEKRAFVTTLSNTHENLLKIQVLYKSLRMNKANEDVVVILPETILTTKLQKELTSFGFVLYPINKKMLEEHNNPQGLSIWAFEMTQYERLVYLDPFSLVLDNIDELFTCAGYCASLNSKSKESPVVLEPSMKTFTSLTHDLTKSSSDFMGSLQLIMNLESCPTFSQHVIANAETSEQCFNKEANLLTECHQLPVEYGVLSSDFAAQSIHKDMVCTICGFEKPKIVTYPALEDTWESFMKTRKAIVSKWDNVRSTLPISDEMRKDAFLSFSIAISCCFFVLYFYDQRCQLAKSRQSLPFPPSLASLPVFTDSSLHSGTAVLLESVLCTTMTPLNPNSYRLGLANKSSVRLLVIVLLTVAVGSLWYHFSLIMGQVSSSFEWDPLASLAVGYSWTTLLLLTGLQLMDYCYGLFQNEFCRLVRELGFALFAVFVVLIAFPKDQQVFYMQVFVCVLAVWTSECFVRRSASAAPAASPLVQSHDISVVLSISVVYFLLSYVLVMLNVPIVLRTVLIRSLGMLHFAIVLFVAIAVICGDHLSDIIRKATLHQRSSSVNILQYFHWFKQIIKTLCRTLKTILCRPLCFCCIICLIGIVVIYIKLFLARGSNIPRTSPYFCLHQRGKYLNAEGGVSSGCGAREAFSIEHPNDSVFSETFSQKYFCVKNTKPVPRIKRSHNNNRNKNWWELVFVTGVTSTQSMKEILFRTESSKHKERENKKYISPSLLVHNQEHHAYPECVPSTQFVFILPRHSQVEDSKRHYCLYNSRNGNFLTSSSTESNFCGQTEKWEVVPTHAYIYVLNNLVSVLYPLKYRFTYLNPFLSMVVIFMLTQIARKIENYPFLSVTLYSAVAVLSLYLFHVITIWIIWGVNFDIMRQFNTDAMLSFQKALGILTGPQYFRTITMLPDECPETLWFTSLLFFSSSFPVFLVLLSCIQKRKLTVDDEKYLHYSRDELDDEEVQSEKDLSFNVSIMSRVACCAIGSLLLDLLLNLVLPVQFISSAYSSKSSCTNFEERFGLISFDKEYVDNVVLFTNVIFLMGMKYSTSPCFFSFCILYTVVVYLLIWLTVESSYVFFISKFCVTIVSWISISHKLSSYFEFLINKNRKVKVIKEVEERKLGRHRSMPNILLEDKDRKINSPKYKQLTRNQSSFFVNQATREF